MTKTAGELAFYGRFARPTRTDEVPLGPCRCKGTPHAEDLAYVRSEIGDSELRSAAQEGGYSNGHVWDAAAADDATIAAFTTSWNLLEENGDPVPVSRGMIKFLDEETRIPLIAAVNRAAGGSVMISAAAIGSMVAELTDGEALPASRLLASIGILVASRRRALPNGSSGRSRAGTRSTASRSRPRKPKA